MTNLIKFSDNEVITRDFVVYLLLRQLGIEFSVNDYDKIGERFSDISQNSPFASYIIFAKYTGIVNGFPDGTFGAKKYISRGELAKMTYNTFFLNQEKILQAYRAIATNSSYYNSDIIRTASYNFVTLSEVKKLVKNVITMKKDTLYFSWIDEEKIMGSMNLDSKIGGFLNVKNF